jgi:uncharacterized protein (DUF1778 family)
MTAAAKSDRIAVRVSHEQGTLIRQAADAEGVTVTDFTVHAAVAHAHDVLADRRVFELDDAAWAEFLAVLDRPVAYKPRLSKLFIEESIFE